VKSGDIVLVRFPQVDMEPGKVRPALVVALAPGRFADVLLALITSRPYQEVAGFDEVIAPSDADFGATHLKVRSVIRLARLTTVDSESISAKLGSVSAIRMNRIRQRLMQWIAG
jgi:mRNA interferase MazF